LEPGPWLEVEPGRKDVIDVEDWADIRRLHRSEGLSIKEIVRRTGRARNTVRDALRSEGPPSYARPERPWAIDEFDDDIRRLLQAEPSMAATVIAERIGWERSLTVLRDRVAALRGGVSAAGPGLAYRVCRWGDRPA
jgi:transposase